MSRAYEDWPALRAYCTHSAAPVGRMVLRVFGIDDPAAAALSDDVCIGLQLANFAQDVSVDARLGRTYLLQCEIRDHGDDGAVRLMCERARALLASGRELEALTPARLRVQLALYRLGGEAILDAVAACGYRTATHRPVVDDAGPPPHRRRGTGSRCPPRRIAARRGARGARDRRAACLTRPRAPTCARPSATARTWHVVRPPTSTGASSHCRASSAPRSTRCTASPVRWTTMPISTDASRATHASSATADGCARRGPATAPTR